MTSETTFEDELYITNVIIGRNNDLFLIQKIDKITKRTDQIILHLEEWNKISEIINNKIEAKS